MLIRPPDMGTWHVGGGSGPLHTSAWFVLFLFWENIPTMKYIKLIEVVEHMSSKFSEVKLSEVKLG